MASYRAVAAVCEAVVNVLAERYRARDFRTASVDFRVFHARDFNDPPTAGVSLWLYAVELDTAARNAPGREPPGLAVALRFLVTAWGKDAYQQQRILGWTLQALHDNPVLTASVLNGVADGVFAAEESVTVAPDALPVADLLALWRGVTTAPYQASVAFIARPVRVNAP